MKRPALSLKGLKKIYTADTGLSPDAEAFTSSDTTSERSLLQRPPWQTRLFFLAQIWCNHASVFIYYRSFNVSCVWAGMLHATSQTQLLKHTHAAQYGLLIRSGGTGRNLKVPSHQASCSQGFILQSWSVNCDDVCEICSGRQPEQHMVHFHQHGLQDLDQT